MAPKASAAIKKDGHAAIHLFDDSGKRVERGNRSIDLAAPMIRDHHGIYTGIESERGILGMQDALEKDGKARVLTQETDIAPSERRIGE